MSGYNHLSAAYTRGQFTGHYANRVTSQSKRALAPVITAYFKELVPLTFNSPHLEQSKSYLEKDIEVKYKQFPN